MLKAVGGWWLVVGGWWRRLMVDGWHNNSTCNLECFTLCALRFKLCLRLYLKNLESLLNRFF